MGPSFVLDEKLWLLVRQLRATSLQISADCCERRQEPCYGWVMFAKLLRAFKEAVEGNELKNLMSFISTNTALLFSCTNKYVFDSLSETAVLPR